MLRSIAWLALFLAPQAVAQSATVAPLTEFVCPGKVTNFSDRSLVRPATDVYVRLTPKVLHIVGDVFSGDYPVTRIQENLIVFSDGDLMGNLYRFSGEISLAESVPGEKRVKWIYSGKCEKPRPLF